MAYWAFLTGHDINFYLTDRPPAFAAALAVAGVAGAALAIVLARQTLSWLLVVPLVVFENVLPVRAFAESARRMDGRRKAAALPARGVGWRSPSSLPIAHEVGACTSSGARSPRLSAARWPAC